MIGGNKNVTKLSGNKIKLTNGTNIIFKKIPKKFNSNELFINIGIVLKKQIDDIITVFEM